MTHAAGRVLQQLRRDPRTIALIVVVPIVLETLLEQIFKGQPGVGPLGLIGFSLGGDLAWQMATQSPDLKAVVAFYGANPPLRMVPDIQAAVYAVRSGLA